MQVHVGHGFLLSQFLSPLFSHSIDQYGDAIATRCKVIVDIIKNICLAVGYLSSLTYRLVAATFFR